MISDIVLAGLLILTFGAIANVLIAFGLANLFEDDPRTAVLIASGLLWSGLLTLTVWILGPIQAR